MGRRTIALCVLLSLSLLLPSCGGDDGGTNPVLPDPTQPWRLHVTNDCWTTDIQLRVFDVDNGIQYPERNLVWRIEFQDSRLVEVECIEGATVCYGAGGVFPFDGGYWGVGLENNHDCDDCCYRCTRGTIDSITLTCS